MCKLEVEINVYLLSILSELTIKKSFYSHKFRDGGHKLMKEALQ